MFLSSLHNFVCPMLLLYVEMLSIFISMNIYFTLTENIDSATFLSVVTHTVEKQLPAFTLNKQN